MLLALFCFVVVVVVVVVAIFELKTLKTQDLQDQGNQLDAKLCTFVSEACASDTMECTALVY